MKPPHIPQLDALRGFALVGIVLVNAPNFIQPKGSVGT
jgi:uncharacterized membrane protein YeiB